MRVKMFGSHSLGALEETVNSFIDDKYFDIAMDRILGMKKEEFDDLD